MEIFPKIDLFPRVTKVVEFLFGTIDAEVAYPSEHRRLPEPSTTGAAFMLDQALDQPTLPFGEK